MEVQVDKDFWMDGRTEDLKLISLFMSSLDRDALLKPSG